jgi:hypothetical protein
MRPVRLTSFFTDRLTAQLDAAEAAIVGYDWPELPVIPESVRTLDAVETAALVAIKSQDPASYVRSPNQRAIHRSFLPLPVTTTDSEGSESAPDTDTVLREACTDLFYAIQSSHPVLTGIMPGLLSFLPGHSDAAAWMGWHHKAGCPGFRLECHYVGEDEQSFFRWELEGSSNNELLTEYNKAGWNFWVYQIRDQSNPFWHSYYTNTLQAILQIDLGEFSPVFVRSFLQQ